MSNWCSAGLVGFVLMTTSAYAASDPLAGAWRFRSENATLGCVISGDATLTPGDTTDQYDVSLTAYEHCGREYEGRAIEVCQAQRVGAHLSLRCGVLRTIPRHAYFPDDFELDLRPDGTMAGALTANWNTPAFWRRGGNAAPVA